MSYYRIGTDYYKEVQKPLGDNESLGELVKWKKAEIITDEGKDFLDTIEKYDGFTLIPSHTNFQQTYKNFFNRYRRVDHKFNEGEFRATEAFLKHVFGNQYELGLDYLNILWSKPKQILPILCLVSSERNTGKTTFLKFLKLIFQSNLTVNTNEEFRARFNTDWTNKLLICIDEVLLEKREDSERLKHLSTATSFKSESKGVDKEEGLFYGKFVLCSNNETSFINIDKDEIRYWVVKLHPFTTEDPELLSKLKEELPAFMYCLNQREIRSPKMTRMWFTPDQIRTDALLRLIDENQDVILREIKEFLLDDFARFEVDELYYTSSDLVEKLKLNNVRVTSNRISKVLKQYLNLESINSSYNKYYLSKCIHGDGFLVEKSTHKGRYYTFPKALIT